MKSHQGSAKEGPWFRVDKSRARSALEHGGTHLLALVVALEWLRNEQRGSEWVEASASILSARTGISVRQVRRLLHLIKQSGIAQMESGKAVGRGDASIPNRFRFAHSPLCQSDTLPSVSQTLPLVTGKSAELAHTKERKKVKNPPTPKGEKSARESKGNHPIPFPPELDTSNFREAWSEWEQHLRELRKPITPSRRRKQLEKCAEWGEATAIANISHSILSGWQGIFPPKGSPLPQHPPSSPSPTIPPEPPGWRERRRERFPNARDTSWSVLSQTEPELARELMGGCEAFPDGIAAEQDAIS